jgi:hypothetical protein
MMMTFPSRQRKLSGLPTGATTGLSENFRIDATHSNAFTAWKEMGLRKLPRSFNTSTYRMRDDYSF